MSARPTGGIAYLGLGSNLGNREETLRRAVTLLAEEVVVEQISSLYETPPWGYQEQPAFLNAACRVRTTLSPSALLQEMQWIETTLGRRREQRWGPRAVDLDLLFYNDLVLDTPDLVLPHPLLHERAFVLVPLAEIAPHLCHPLLKRTVAELLARLPDRDTVHLWAPAAFWTQGGGQ